MCVGECYGLQRFHVGGDNADAGGFDGVAGDVKLGEVVEAAEEDAGEALEGVDGGERMEVGGEGGGEVDDWGVAVEESEGCEGG